MQNNQVKLRFLSTLRHAVGMTERTIEINREATVGDLLTVISATYDRKVSDFFFEGKEKALKNDILILVNDTDIGVLNGTRTVLCDGDEVVLMPVSHGG